MGTQVSHHLGQYQRAQFLGHMVKLCFLLWETTKLPKWLHHFAFPIVMNECPCCYTLLSLFGIVSIPDCGHFNKCVVVSRCCFNLYLPDDICCEASFHTFTYYLYIFFDEVSVKIFIPFLQLDCWSYWVLRILCIFLDNSSFWDVCFSNIFPPCVVCLIILLILSFVDPKC